jgi:hypothetical protein
LLRVRVVIVLVLVLAGGTVAARTLAAPPVRTAAAAASGMKGLRDQIVALDDDFADISYSKIAARAKQIAKAKEVLMGSAFPPVYGIPFLRLYLRIDGIDVELEDGLSAARSTKSRQAVVDSLNIAGYGLKRLAELLRRQHGSPGAASTLEGLAIDAHGLATEAEDGPLGPIQSKIRKLQKRLATVGSLFPKIYGANFATVFDKLQTIDSILEEQIPQAIAAKLLSDVLEPKLRSLLLRAATEADDLATAFANAPPPPPTLSKYHFQGLTDQFTTAAPQNVTVTESFSGDFCGTDPLKGTWTITATDPPFSKQPFKEAANFGSTNPFTANKTSTYLSSDPNNILGTSASTLELVPGTAPQMKLSVTLTGGDNNLSYPAPTQVSITVTPVAPCPPS